LGVRLKVFICFSLIALLTVFQLPFSVDETAYAKEKVPPSIKEVYVEMAEKPKPGDKVKFVVLAEGENLQYEWHIYKNEEVIYVENYSADNYFEYTLDGIGLYRAEAKVKDEFLATSIKSSQFIDVEDPTPLKIHSLIVDKTPKQPINTSLEFIVSAEGYGLSYDWIIYRDSEKVYSNTGSDKYYQRYTPNKPGTYKALVYVRDYIGRYASQYSETITIYSNESAASPNVDRDKVESFVNGKGFASKSQYFIWTDTTKKLVYVFEGKAKEWKLIKTMSATVGKASTPTIKGSFAINGRGPWLISENPNVRARYKVRIKGGYYFHSILVNPQGKVIDSRLGQALSHGCVRLSMENAIWMYNNVKDGTGVFIN
jgi:lipoprotein-anchoring transpeptidase ErfK/SrfK